MFGIGGCEDESRPARVECVEENVTTQCPCDETTHVESQSESGAVMVEFFKMLKDDVGLFYWHARACVCYDELHLFIVGMACHAEGDSSACGVLAGIGEEIV